MRIAIIGAGPAGLIAAEVLKDKGSEEVTVFERSNQAGGKCCSIEYEGSWHELGAAILAENQRTVLDLAKKYQVKTTRVDLSLPELLLDGHSGLPLPPRSLIDRLRLIRQAIRYRGLVKNNAQVTQPGLSNIPLELCVPFTEWAAEHKLPLVAYEFAKYFTGFGYDFLDQIAAAYVLKYYSWETLWSALRKKFYKFPGGIQNLWKEVAKQHHVLYGTTVKQVKRGRTITLTTNHGEHTFDRLILAAPLDEALAYLSPTSEESSLFSKIQYCDYRVFACILENFPKQVGYAPGNYTATRKGQPVFWYTRHPDSNLFTFYLLSDEKMTDAQLEENIRMFIRPLGGTLKSVLTVAHWKYFPHVSPEDLKEGYFDRLEALQGQNSTYYAGELLNFSTVEQSAWYAKTLIERFF